MLFMICIGNRNSLNGSNSQPSVAQQKHSKLPAIGGLTGLSDSDSEMSDSGAGSRGNSVIVKSSPSPSPPPPAQLVITQKHSKASKKPKKQSKLVKPIPAYSGTNSDMSESSDSSDDELLSGRDCSPKSHSLAQSAMLAQSRKLSRQEMTLPTTKSLAQTAVFPPASSSTRQSPIDRAALSSGYGTDRLSVSPAQSAINSTSSPALKHQQPYSSGLDYSELHGQICRVVDGKKLQKVVDLIDERNFECLQVIDDRLEFDLKKLDYATLVKIRRIVC